MSSMFAPAHSSSSSCSHPTPLTLTSSPLTTSHETRTMTLWPKHNLPQVMSPTWPTPLMSSKLFLHSCRVRMSTLSTILTTTMRSLLMLRLTTSISEMRSLYHCFHRTAKQKSIWDKLITRMKNVCVKVHSQCQQGLGNPSSGWQKRKSSQELDDDQIRIILEIQKEHLLAEAKIRNPEAWVQYGSCRKSNSCTEQSNWVPSIGNWTYSRRTCTVHENKIYFTKNWQIENEHFVTLVLDEFMKWKNWRGSMSCELMNFRSQKIVRKSKHNQWAHGQGTGITKRDQLYEWFERI